jgi:hypothetical protein
MVCLFCDSHEYIDHLLVICSTSFTTCNNFNTHNIIRGNSLLLGSFTAMWQLTVSLELHNRIYVQSLLCVYMVEKCGSFETRYYSKVPLLILYNFF